MRDIRLYYYTSGTLNKVGKGKTGLNKHLFDNVEECRNRIIDIFNSQYRAYHNTQFLIVEYFGDYTSKIIEMVQYDNK